MQASTRSDSPQVSLRGNASYQGILRMAALTVGLASLLLVGVAALGDADGAREVTSEGPDGDFFQGIPNAPRSLGLPPPPPPGRTTAGGPSAKPMPATPVRPLETRVGGTGYIYRDNLRRSLAD